MAIIAADIEWRQGLPYSHLFQEFYISPSEEAGSHESAFLQKSDLKQVWQSLSQDCHSFTIAETGFGAGLNFLSCSDLWLDVAPESSVLEFFSAELFPINKVELAKILSQLPHSYTLSSELIENYPVPVAGIHSLELFQGRIRLHLMFGDANEMFSSISQSANQEQAHYNRHPVDLWFLDGFEPANNPGMWSPELMGTIASLSDQHTTALTANIDNKTISTISDNLKSAGFLVQSTEVKDLQKSTLKGLFIGEKSQPFKLDNSPGANLWHLDKLVRPLSARDQEVTIIGAGIAGCTTAVALTKRGFKVKVLDRHTLAGQGGSGNSQAIVYPKLSPRDEVLPRINLRALMFASRYYAPFWKRGLGQQCGVICLPENPKIAEDFIQISQRFSNCEDFVQLLKNNQLCDYSGISLESSLGLFFPQLGWLPPAIICQQLLEDHKIPLINTDIDHFKHQLSDNRWHLFDTSGKLAHSTDILVLATAYGCQTFEQTKALPVTQLRGQISQLPARAKTKSLKTIICGDGYITPALDNYHSCGATYNKGLFSTELRAEDHEMNIAQMRQTDSGLDDALDNLSVINMPGRANFRCTTKDYLPIVGPVPNFSSMIEDFGFLRRDARANSIMKGNYLPNLYINCGMGSRGLSYAPFTAELLASQISQQIPSLERELIQGMHPARFLIRDLKKKRL
ncbi:MAG: tRNA 5-methylaminomethyl-2-thiouridine biosynthesis bifunctional protein [Porticoccaceae bacterium]